MAKGICEVANILVRAHRVRGRSSGTRLRLLSPISPSPIIFNNSFSHSDLCYGDY